LKLIGFTEIILAAFVFMWHYEEEKYATKEFVQNGTEQNISVAAKMAIT
jgi:hypothetical protein